jgi:hypothetical protein
MSETSQQMASDHFCRLRELMAIFKASLRDGDEQLDLARVRDIMRQLD